MVGRNNQDYPFIKEIIKKRPANKKAVILKLVMAAFCGIVFGIFAVLTIVILMPSVQKAMGKNTEAQEIVRLSPTIVDQAESSSDSEMIQDRKNSEISESAAVESDQTEDTASALQADESSTGEEAEIVVGETDAEDLTEHLENIYDRIKEVVREPQKALVRVSGIGENQDLLDHSSLTYGDEEGIIFLKNQEAFYILTISESLGESGDYRVIFSTGDSAEGTLCGMDSRTGLMVIRVSVEEVNEESRDSIPAVSLALTQDQEQADPVIALGSPTGDSDTLVYGNITSIHGRYQIADAEYMILTTDMVGSSNGSGVLLNMEGQMIGIIFTDGDEDENVIRAISSVELRPLLEVLSNGEAIRYMGILGETVTEEQSDTFGIPKGIYVDSVEENSPAMAEGIQSGDILFKINGEEITSMEEYSGALQKLPLWQKTAVSVYRRNPSGEYVEVELKVMIKKVTNNF